jgi:AcrR family transcriptional regulator
MAIQNYELKLIIMSDDSFPQNTQISAVVRRQVLAHFSAQNDYHDQDQGHADPIRKQLIEARRNQILDAATTVFAKKSFHRATIKDVARTAGIAEGTIYNYFKNKGDLLVAMVARMGEITQFSDQIGQMAGTASAEQVLNSILQNRFDLLHRNRAEVLALLPQIISDPDLRRQSFETLIEPTLAKFEQLWQNQMEIGQIRRLNPRVLVRLFFGMILGLTLLDIVGDSIIARDKDLVADTIQDLFLHGLLPLSEAGDDLNGA